MFVLFDLVVSLSDLSFFPFLISWQLVTAFLIIKTIILLGLAGCQIIIMILGLSYVPRWLSSISSAPSLYANLRVPTRVYDVEGGAIFPKNSTFVFCDGAAWTPRLRSPSSIMVPPLSLIISKANTLVGIPEFLLIHKCAICVCCVPHCS